MLPIMKPVAIDEADTALKAAVEISIARQISISQNQRQLLHLPALAGPSASALVNGKSGSTNKNSAAAGAASSSSGSSSRRVPTSSSSSTTSPQRPSTATGGTPPLGPDSFGRLGRPNVGGPVMGNGNRAMRPSPVNTAAARAGQTAVPGGPIGVAVLPSSNGSSLPRSRGFTVSGRNKDEARLAATRKANPVVVVPRPATMESQMLEHRKSEKIVLEVA